jgi:hypothetical protein
VAVLVSAVLLLSLAAPAAAAIPQQSVVTQSGGSISLTVTDGDDPVAGADVTVSRNGEAVLSGETGAEGQLNTGPLEDGSYTVTVTEPGYHERAVSVTVDGAEVRRTLALDPGSVDLSIQAADGRTNEPLADVLVEVEGVGSVRTAGDGTQTVRVPVNSQLSVSVSKPKYETASATVVVDESPESVTLETTRSAGLSLSLARTELAAGETVEATVTDAYGDPVAGASVLVDGEAVAETGGDGTASVPVETAGEHTVRARAGGTLSEQVTVVAEQSAGAGTATASSTEKGTANGTATETEDSGTVEDLTPTQTPVPTATAAGETNESNPFPDVASDVDLPELAWGEGPLGVLPPFEGPVRIVSVIALVGFVGLLYSVFGSRDL